MMEEINQAIAQLQLAISHSDMYHEYHRQEELLRQNPELQARVDQFRYDNFRIQNEAQGGDLIQVASEIYRQSRELRKDPQVNAYLDAKLAVCKLVQRISHRLCEGIDFSVPEPINSGEGD